MNLVQFESPFKELMVPITHSLLPFYPFNIILIHDSIWNTHLTKALMQ